MSPPTGEVEEDAEKLTVPSAAITCLSSISVVSLVTDILAVGPGFNLIIRSPDSGSIDCPPFDGAALM